MELTNLKEALHTSFAADKQAIVNSSGRVFWSRPGLLQALCKYRGLVNFPTDTVLCLMRGDVYNAVFDTVSGIVLGHHSVLCVGLCLVLCLG